MDANQNQAKPIFVIGNKRSGSSLLVQLLNMHPHVFITHESDIAWILEQLARNPDKDALDCYPYDGPLGMNSTMKSCGDLIRETLGDQPDTEQLRDAFYKACDHLMHKGSMVQQTYDKSNLAYVGDKKPVQAGDPDLRPLMGRLFPDARYIHVTRHPQAVVASKTKAAQTWPKVPDFWNGTPEEILTRWAIQEQWAIDVKEKEGCPLHFLKLEDLSANPIEEMKTVFQFLELDTPDETYEAIKAHVKPTPNRKYDSFSIPAVPEVSPLLKRYGYED